MPATVFLPLRPRDRTNTNNMDIGQQGRIGLNIAKSDAYYTWFKKSKLVVSYEATMPMSTSAVFKFMPVITCLHYYCIEKICRPLYEVEFNKRRS